MPPLAIIDLKGIDFSRVVADKDTIRKVLPQRHEMEQIDAVVHCDKETGLVVGYKDVGSNEFWVKGHLPGFPVYPGVLLCECAAQLCSYHALTMTPINGEFIAFGGLENVRFRSMVVPGDRLVMVGKAGKINRRQMNYAVQGFVGDSLVFHGDIMGLAVNWSPDKKEKSETDARG